MKVTHMRWMDRTLGIPLCWMLGAVMAFRRKRRPGAVRRILVIKFFGLGSIVLATPALSLLRKRFPDARIEFLTFSANGPLLERISLIDAIHTINPRSLASLTVDVLRAVHVLRRDRIDLVLDFEFFSKLSTLLSGLTGAPRRVAFALPARWRTMLVTDPVALTKDRHVSHSFAAQVFLFASRASLPAPVAPRIDAADQAALGRALPHGGSEIVINVNAGPTFLERRWPPERFAELADALCDRTASWLVFIGDASERAYVQRVVDAVRRPGRCLNVAGNLAIAELMALLRRSTLLISNDSGPLHLACALGTPVVALYGPETPSFYGPLGGRRTVVYGSPPCSPCMNVYQAKAFRCPYDARCMRDIGTEEVLRAVNRYLPQAAA